MVRCPCHDDREASLSLRDGERQLVVKCFAECDGAGIIAELRRRGLLEGSPQPRAPVLRLERREPDEAERSANALRLWNEARTIEGTPIWRYLAKRGCSLEHLPPDLNSSLRWHPSCPFERDRQGCLVALWTDVLTGEPKAIHRRPISGAGEKLADWRALGPTRDSIIRLWPDDAVTQGLVLGEGIETCLAAATSFTHKGTRLAPAWAAGDAGHLARFPVLAGIDALTLLVDNDEAGRAAAAECAERWQAAGREVIRLASAREGEDFADIAEAGL